MCCQEFPLSLFDAGIAFQCLHAKASQQEDEDLIKAAVTPMSEELDAVVHGAIAKAALSRVLRDREECEPFKVAVQVARVRQIHISICSFDADTLGTWTSVFEALDREKLEDLSITTSHMGRIPDSLGELTGLLVLNVQQCSSLREIPESVGRLKHLTSLGLRGCTSLRSLPQSTGDLTRLTSLNLEGCVLLEALPVTLCHLPKLTSLNLKACKSLQSVPEELKQLPGFIAGD